MTEAPGKPRYILNHVYGSAEEILLDPAARDNVADPYIRLRDRCAELGYDFEGVHDQDLAGACWLFFWDAWLAGASTLFERLLIRAKIRRVGGTFRDVFREAQRRGMHDKLVLFMYEPPSVCPANFDPKVQEQFAVVFTWDPDLVDNRKYFQIYLPSSTSYRVVEPRPFAEKKLLVDISSYKFLEHERGLNEERRRAIRFFEQHYPEQFDLYGAGWNPSLWQFLRKRLVNRQARHEHYPSYRGQVASKAETMKNYKFAIAYENILDQKGYVSIKIFDCLRSGCVPVYLGAQDIEEYVDRDAFVDRRAFGSLEELAAYLTSVSAEEHEEFLAAARRYLQGEKFARFLDEHFVETVVRALGLGLA